MTQIHRIVAMIALLLALGQWPNAYYEVLRIVLAVATLIEIGLTLGRPASVGIKIFWLAVFAVIAVLFNPIAVFPFTRETWSILDVLGIASFLAVALMNRRARS